MDTAKAEALLLKMGYKIKRPRARVVKLSKKVVARIALALTTDGRCVVSWQPRAASARVYSYGGYRAAQKGVAKARSVRWGSKKPLSPTLHDAPLPA